MRQDVILQARSKATASQPAASQPQLLVETGHSTPHSLSEERLLLPVAPGEWASSPSSAPPTASCAQAEAEAGSEQGQQVGKQMAPRAGTSSSSRVQAFFSLCRWLATHRLSALACVLPLVCPPLPTHTDTPPHTPAAWWPGAPHAPSPARAPRSSCARPALQGAAQHGVHSRVGDRGCGADRCPGQEAGEHQAASTL